MVTELIYTHLIDKMNKKELPKIFRENQMRWCQLIVKSPKMQEFYVHFTDKLDNIMRQELENNGDLYDMYMKHPRPNSKVRAFARSLSPGKKGSPEPDGPNDDFMNKLYPAIRNEKALFQRERKVTQAIDNVKFNYKEL